MSLSFQGGAPDLFSFHLGLHQLHGLLLQKHNPILKLTNLQARTRHYHLHIAQVTHH